MSIGAGVIMFVMVAMLAESIWETAKMVWQDGKVSIDRIGALVVGVLLAVGMQIDLFATLGCPFSIPWMGMILTGVLLSRGSNFIHDLLGKMAGTKSEGTTAVLPNITDTGTVTKEQTAATIAVGETEKENPTVENSESEQK